MVSKLSPQKLEAIGIYQEILKPQNLRICRCVWHRMNGDMSCGPPRRWTEGKKDNKKVELLEGRTRQTACERQREPSMLRKMNLKGILISPRNGSCLAFSWNKGEIPIALVVKSSFHLTLSNKDGFFQYTLTVSELKNICHTYINFSVVEGDHFFYLCLGLVGFFLPWTLSTLK